MEITCHIVPLMTAINNHRDKEAFKKFLDGKEFPGGIQLKTYEAWTTKQQGTIYRDIGIAAKLLETTIRAIKSILRRADPTKDLFVANEYVGARGRGKTIEVEKSLSEFTKEDCIDAIPVIREYLEILINTVYQEVVVINWSDKENKENKLPDYEFTGRPYSP